MKTIAKTLITLAIFSLATCDAFASATVTVTTTNGGSPYVAKVTSGSVGIYNTGDQFNTFCLEHGEYFNPWYQPTDTGYTASISSVANGGGWVWDGQIGQSNRIEATSGDQLDERTAYLYTKYMGNQAMCDATLLQQTIHYIEAETSSLSDLTYFNEADLAVTSGAWTGLGNVRVLNIAVETENQDGLGYLNPGLARQDQLILVPTPSALMIGSIGAVLIGLLKRKKAL